FVAFHQRTLALRTGSPGSLAMSDPRCKESGHVYTTASTAYAASAASKPLGLRSVTRLRSRAREQRLQRPQRRQLAARPVDASGREGLRSQAATARRANLLERSDGSGGDAACRP